MVNINTLKFFVEELESLQHQYEQNHMLRDLFTIGQTQYKIYNLVKEWGEPTDPAKRIEELERIAAESYCVMSVLASEAGRLDDPYTVKAMDNAFTGNLEHKDILPYPSKVTLEDIEPKSEAMSPAEIAQLKFENESILAANRECVQYYELLYSEYQKLKSSMTDIRKTLDTVRHTNTDLVPPDVLEELRKISWLLKDLTAP